MEKVTMKDIADALNISRVTVSKAFNNQAGVSDALRETIFDKARELGYTKTALPGTDRQPGAGCAGRTDRGSGGVKAGVFFFLDRHHTPYGTGAFRI